MPKNAINPHNVSLHSLPNKLIGWKSGELLNLTSSQIAPASRAALMHVRNCRPFLLYICLVEGDAAQTFTPNWKSSPERGYRINCPWIQLFPYFTVTCRWGRRLGGSSRGCIRLARCLPLFVAPLAKPFRLPATISRSLPLTKIQHDGLGH